MAQGVIGLFQTVEVCHDDAETGWRCLFKLFQFFHIGMPVFHSGQLVIIGELCPHIRQFLYELRIDISLKAGFVYDMTDQDAGE